MKILEIALFDVGACGPTSVLKQIINRLTGRNHKIDVFSAYNYSEERKKLANSLGVRYFSTSGERILKTPEILKYVPEIKSYDIVHIHGIYDINHIIIANFLYKNKIPYIVSIHGNLMKSAVRHSRIKKTIAINLLIKKMLSRAAAIHVMAKEEYKDVKNIVGNQNYQLIYNGVNSSGYEKGYVIQESTEKITLLYIGRLDVRHKGIDLLLDAIERKAGIFRNKLHLYLVGPFDTQNDKEVIIKKIEKSDCLKEIVSIEGPKYGEDKNEYFGKSDLFIHTSRYEGMPIAVLEAMDAGIPCIVTPGTNMATIIDKCDGGFVIDGTADDIASSLEKITNINKEIFLIKGKSAKEWSKKNLNWDTIAIQYEKMYQELSNK
jgi:glycosyltransferase involved in cell wall biosynthesis